ncbi:MAG TPA: hypothetical protein VGS07_23180 [Thermoanaerobaculia bacterium]|jgi:hypothetical protein|nr:hypothetical protein [Thermoanaerobaculia bacterium]
MEDPRSRQITELLYELPREHARPGFTARVLEQLDAKPHHASRWNFRLAPAMAAITVAALLAVAISAGPLIEWQGKARKHQEAIQALRELRAEHGRLEAELQEMSEPPVVYLGGDEKVDYVLDLGKVREAELVTSATPAAYHIDTF